METTPVISSFTRFPPFRSALTLSSLSNPDPSTGHNLHLAPTLRWEEAVAPLTRLDCSRLSVCLRTQFLDDIFCDLQGRRTAYLLFTSEVFPFTFKHVPVHPCRALLTDWLLPAPIFSSPPELPRARCSLLAFKRCQGRFIFFFFNISIPGVTY